MDLDGNSLLASLMIGLVGTALFIYGKKQGRFPHMLTGAVLVVYPYFVSNVALMASIGVGIVAMLWGAVKMGM